MKSLTKSQEADSPEQPYRAPTKPDAHAHAHAEEKLDLPEAPNPKPGTLFKIILGVAILVGLGFVAGLLPKLHQRAALNEEAGQRAEAKLRVQVAHPQASDKLTKTTLPGTVSALREAIIYARTSGYLKQRNVDRKSTRLNSSHI